MSHYKKPSPKKMYVTEKVELPDNPYYCIGCNKEYTEKNNDINAEYMEDYCRYLGFCNINCWNKLSDYEKWDHADAALLKGSITKHKHKFYLKNVKGYR